MSKKQTVRLTAEELQALDDWCQESGLSRSEALRRIFAQAIVDARRQKIRLVSAESTED